MRRTRSSILAALLAVGVLAGPAAAAAPTRTVLEIPPFTLADALAEYEEFGAYHYDCGDFVIISTFTGQVTVTDWGDRMLRHVEFSGRFYNASDLTKSALRIGNTATWRDFDDAGDWVQVRIHGISSMAVLDDGRHLPVDVGYVVGSLVLEETIHQAGPSGNIDELCDALR